MDGDEFESPAQWPAEVDLLREARVGDRVYQVHVRTARTGPAEFSMISCDGDGQVISNISGKLALADGPAFARMLSVELAVLERWSPPAERKAYTVAGRRKEHPNAYRPWDGEQEERLLSRYRAGATLEQLSAELGRNVGGIRARLERLGELDMSAQPGSASGGGGCGGEAFHHVGQEPDITELPRDGEGP
jgi:hypothetical protein